MSSVAEELKELRSLLESGAVKCTGNLLRLKKTCEELEASIGPQTPTAGDSSSASAAAVVAVAPPENLTRSSKSKADATDVPAANGATEASSIVKKTSRSATRTVDPNVMFVPVDSFGWDQSDKNVSIYVSGLDGVGALGDQKNNVVCDFTSKSFDLRVLNLKGKNYRLCKDNLDKEIVPDKSKVKVKANKIVLLLRKVPGKYGAEHWTDLAAKRKKKKVAGGKEDPMAGIMDLMKDMYDSGDDQMRATIGKAMMDARLGKKPKEPSMPSFDNDLGGKTTI